MQIDLTPAGLLEVVRTFHFYIGVRKTSRQAQPSPPVVGETLGRLAGVREGDRDVGVIHFPKSQVAAIIARKQRRAFEEKGGNAVFFELVGGRAHGGEKLGVPQVGEPVAAQKNGKDRIVNAQSLKASEKKARKP